MTFKKNEHMNTSVKMFQTSILFFLMLLLFNACRVEPKPTESNLPASNLQNVSYGTDTRQSMDVYLPAGRKKATTPFIILIHGGGWTSGSRSDLRPFVDTIRKRLPNHAVFNISYRLAANGQNLFPTQENDVKAAVELILAKQEEYQISNRYALLGASAGGHLALLNAYKEANSQKAKAVVSFFGPTELIQFFNNPPSPLVPILLQTVTGFTPATNLQLYQSSSPALFAKASSVPTMMIHGGADLVVPSSQSVLLRDKLSVLNVPHEYVFYPNGGHGDWDAATYADAFQRLQVFLQLHLP